MLLLMKYQKLGESYYGDDLFCFNPIGIYPEMAEIEDVVIRLEFLELEDKLSDSEYTRSLLLDPDPLKPLKFTWPQFDVIWYDIEHSVQLHKYHLPLWEQKNMVAWIEADWVIWNCDTEDGEPPFMYDGDQVGVHNQYLIIAINVPNFVLSEAIPDLHD